MSNINIRRVIDNIRSGTTVYTPVIELIVNAIQAIPKEHTGGLVRVTVLRASETNLLDELQSAEGSTLQPVDGFAVTDNGVGFTQTNRDAFDELYTDNKAQEGGKGFGRFACLKYFNKLHVESVFRNGDRFCSRNFDMGVASDIIINESVTSIPAQSTGTTVTIVGMRKVKMQDRSLDLIARVLVEKLLPYLVAPACPRIVIEDRDGSAPVVLNDYLSGGNGHIIELAVDNPNFGLAEHGGTHAFLLRVFKFYSARTLKSKISLVAHRREVTDVTLVTYVPEFADEFYDADLTGDEGRDRNYIVKAYVFGAYLDDNVSLERGAFHFGRDPDIFHPVGQLQIESAAAETVRDVMGAEITPRRERKQKRIDTYVSEQAPWHASVAKDTDFSSLPMNPSALDIELHLQRRKHALEINARTEVANILEDEEVSDLSERVARVLTSISQTSRNDLAHYVSMRKCVLDLFGRSLQRDEHGAYRSEGEVHDIIVPRKRDSDRLDYGEHNLWILDERLNFADYLTSDLPMNGPNSDRPDISIFNRKVAFRGDNEPSNPIIIFEFKRPIRRDFANPSSDDDPVDQLVRYVRGFREGKYQTPEGRPVRVTDTTPFYGYVVCDLVPRVEGWLREEKDFNPMPDGLGWFRWFGNINLYIEVLSWDKVLKDADMRNRVFFHKLGI